MHFFPRRKHVLGKVPAAGCVIETISVLSQARPRLQRGGSSASLHNSLMRNSIFQLMIHTLDPLSEGEMVRQTAHRKHNSEMPYFTDVLICFP